jgi:molybdopterin synthase catalytic subunit
MVAPQPLSPQDAIAPDLPDLVARSQPLSPNLEWSVQPPESFRITSDPLDLGLVHALAQGPENGAVVTMTGMVRNQTDGRPVIALGYEAYEPMALKVFANIVAAIHAQWGDHYRVVIHHRVGYLSVGELSVAISVGSPHRAEAFAACQYAIDTLKHNAPIWKKEYWADGSSGWVSIAACDRAN